MSGNFHEDLYIISCLLFSYDWIFSDVKFSKPKVTMVVSVTKKPSPETKIKTVQLKIKRNININNIMFLDRSNRSKL